MEAEVWGNSLGQWLRAGAVAAGLFMLLFLVRRILVIRLGTLAKRTTNPFDDALVEVIGRTRL